MGDFGSVAGKNLVEAVAIPAMRRLHVSERRHLRVECIAVGLALFVVASAASRGGLHLPSRRPNTSDLVRGMAIGANRRRRITRPQLLAMNACHVIPLRSCMAGAAGCRDVGAIGAAGGILLAQNLVRSVTTRATGRHQQPVLGQRESMDGIHVLRIHLGEPVLLGELRITMAGSAGARQVRWISAGFRIARRQELRGHRHGSPGKAARSPWRGRSRRRRRPDRCDRCRTSPGPLSPGAGNLVRGMTIRAGQASMHAGLKAGALVIVAGEALGALWWISG